MTRVSLVGGLKTRIQEKDEGKDEKIKHTASNHIANGDIGYTDKCHRTNAVN